MFIFLIKTVIMIDLAINHACNLHVEEQYLIFVGLVYVLNKLLLFF